MAVSTITRETTNTTGAAGILQTKQRTLSNILDDGLDGSRAPSRNQ